MILDASTKTSNITFEDKRYGFVTETDLKGHEIILFKPTMFMNLSGDAMRYWSNKGNIDQRRLFVVSGDVASPLGEFRLKGSGNNDGYNGLGHIQQPIGQNYPCLRMGIGNEYPRGGQVDWVFGYYDETDVRVLQPVIGTTVEVIRNFVLAGIDIITNQSN